MNSRALVVAVIQIAIVLSLAGKLVYDRATKPRVWVKTVTVDPDLPIRGRYMILRLQARAPWFNPQKDYEQDWVQLSQDGNELVASRSENDTGVSISTWRIRTRTGEAQRATYFPLDQTVPFFVPEHAIVPSAARGEELWAEVTIPRKGPPRPIQLAVKDAKGWHPLNLR